MNINVFFYAVLSTKEPFKKSKIAHIEFTVFYKEFYSEIYYIKNDNTVQFINNSNTDNRYIFKIDCNDIPRRSIPVLRIVYEGKVKDHKLALNSTDVYNLPFRGKDNNIRTVTIIQNIEYQ